MNAFSDRASDFRNRGTEVLGISIDSKFSHLAWYNVPRDKNGIAGMEIPLLSDLKKETARAYGILNEDRGISQRAVFIIDPEGVVKYEVIHDTPIGPNVDEVVRMLEALQHNKETGQACPTNWKKK